MELASGYPVSNRAWKAAHLPRLALYFLHWNPLQQFLSQITGRKFICKSVREVSVAGGLRAGRVETTTFRRMWAQNSHKATSDPSQEWAISWAWWSKPLGHLHLLFHFILQCLCRMVERWSSLQMSNRNFLILYRKFKLKTFFLKWKETQSCSCFKLHIPQKENKGFRGIEIFSPLENGFGVLTVMGNTSQLLLTI